MKIYTYDNKIMTVGGKWMEQPAQPGPGPGLPPFTIRLKFAEWFTPTFYKGTAVQVSSSPNIWDLTYENTSWELLCSNQDYLNEVIDANTTGVTDMGGMFYQCSSLIAVPLFDTSSATDMASMFSACHSLTTVPLFDTSNVTDMGSMFYGCDGLQSIPLFDTSSATYTSSMFQGCFNVQSGALALYQQASTQATPPNSHRRMFSDCGIDTTTGAAELAQIPSDWK